MKRCPCLSESESPCSSKLERPYSLDSERPCSDMSDCSCSEKSDRPCSEKSDCPCLQWGQTIALASIGARLSSLLAPDNSSSPESDTSCSLGRTIFLMTARLSLLQRAISFKLFAKPLQPQSIKLLVHSENCQPPKR